MNSFNNFSDNQLTRFRVLRNKHPPYWISTSPFQHGVSVSAISSAVGSGIEPRPQVQFWYIWSHENASGGKDLDHSCAVQNAHTWIWPEAEGSLEPYKRLMIQHCICVHTVWMRFGLNYRWFMKCQHVDPAEAWKVHEDIGAFNSIGVHWGTFKLSNEVGVTVQCLAHIGICSR